jgi:class 3 adenylate cyclase
MGEQTVLAFDICSSSAMLENLHLTNRTEKYEILIHDIVRFLEKNAAHYNYEIYKFLGDGFILIFSESTSIYLILEFCTALTSECNAYIKEFLRQHIETEDGIPRRGITIGVDKGYITKLSIDGKDEYVGRPINVSTRFQSSLDGEEHTNRALLSLKLYQEIKEPNFKTLCSQTSRTLKNMANNAKVKCYEFDISYYLSKDDTVLRTPVKKEIMEKNKRSNIEEFFNVLQSNATMASASDISALLGNSAHTEQNQE